MRGACYEQPEREVEMSVSEGNGAGPHLQMLGGRGGGPAWGNLRRHEKHAFVPSVQAPGERRGRAQAGFGASLLGFSSTSLCHSRETFQWV